MLRVSIALGAVLAERMRRQQLAEPLETARGLPALVARLQPVSTGPFARPGSPPRLVHRTRFDDAVAADRLRRSRRLVKGRFQAGGVGYVLAGDLELYANAFRRPLARPNERQRRVYDAVRSAGPLTPRQLREESGLLHKQVMPALQRLQEAFLVYEDQVDDDWQRSFYDFASEWPEVELADERTARARAEVLERFLQSFVFATTEQLRDWSRWPARALDAVLSGLETQGRVRARKVAGLGEGWVPAADDAPDACTPPSGTWVLHSGDPIVRAHASELERRLEGREILQYLLIDGALSGAICGHWGFRPYDVEDVVVELPARERSRRRAEILAAVRTEYPAPRHHVLRYAGRSLAPERAVDP
jgi:hypothetical protein